MNLEQERQLLADAKQRGTLSTVGAYFRLSGPGWLQSAITLGGGSLAGSLYLGVLAGFTMLWLQPLAMILGIIMLSAIGYVTLSTGERPFQAINKHVNPVLGWAWALASLAASMVWCMPQFSLATSVLQQNLLPDVLGAESSLGDFKAKLLITGIILVITIAVTWCYDSGSWGIRVYEWLLKIMVAMIVLCFFGVVVRIAMQGGLDWGAVFAGFIPDFSLLYRPAPGFGKLVAEFPEEVQPFWNARIVSEQRNVMIGAAATAVGINMTFLLPYTLLKRKWTKEFRGLLTFDLSTGMFIPFVLATSCVIMSAATQFHPGLQADIVAKRIDDRLDDELKHGKSYLIAQGLGSQMLVPISGPMIPATQLLITARVAESDLFVLSVPEQNALKNAGSGKSQFVKGKNLVPQLTRNERKLALSSRRRDAFSLARSLDTLLGASNNSSGRSFGDYIFGLGVLGMVLSTITILMLISGLVICEILNLPTTGWPYRLGCLVGATGALGPFIWTGSGFYLAIPASIFGMTLLPLAYLTFFFLMNQRNLLGPEMPSGGRRLLWNVLMYIAAGIATFASIFAIWNNPAGWRGRCLGLAAALGLLVLAVAVHFRRKPLQQNDSVG